MKNILLILPISIFLFSSTLSADPQFTGISIGTEKIHEYQNKDKGYAISLPLEWNLKELKEMGLDVLVMMPPNPADGSMHERITVIFSENDDKLNLEKFYSMSLQNLKETLPAFKVEEFSTVRLGNTEAKKLVYYDKEGHHDSKIVQYFVVSKNKVFIITCSADPQEFGKYKSLFEDVAKSFRLLD
jgi:hypothetical protein